MSLFLKLKCLFEFKLNLNGVNFNNKYQNLFISKSGKSHYNIVNFEIENVEHLCSNT